MIFEFLAGIFISGLAIYFFFSIKYLDSINKWILDTSKFIYYSGHPLLDDDEIYDLITNRFKKVFTSLVRVIFKTILFLSIIVLLIAVSVYVIAKINGNGIPNFDSVNSLVSFIFPKFLIRYPFLIGSLIPVLFISFFKKNKNIKNDVYSPIDKFLHYVFLGNKNISKFLFNLEIRFHRKQLLNIEPSQNLYVSGLARAGTTVLMQYLGQLDDFKSLSYKNLPFLFLPKTGLKLISNKKNEETERTHKDGITHGINTYEALEEPFWRNYIGSTFIFKDIIQKHSIKKDFFEKYNIFRQLISDNKIFLAKNNNHLLRATSLHKLDKSIGNKTITIIPFRNPLQQAKSLLNQHLILSELQREDEFTLDYMDFLSHHEFGLHSKVPVLNEKKTPSINYNKNSIEYWLEIWYFFYSEVYKQFNQSDGFYFFSYESFVKDPKNSLKRILDLMNIKNNKLNSIVIKEYVPKVSKESKKIESKYSELYKKLQIKAINNT